MPIFSIITPAYNSSKYVAETIRSVQAQTYKDWEMLIVDDCSSDNTAEVVESFAKEDNRICLIRLEKNSGAAYARNKALKCANGRYIAFLDSDDIWLPDKLTKQLEFMSTNNYAFTFTDYGIIDEKSHDTGKTIEMPQIIDYNSYLKNTIIGCLTVVIDRQLTKNFQMPDIRTSQDMALWLQIMKRGFKAYALNETLAYYRSFSGSTTANKINAAKDVWRVYREFEKLNIFYSIYCFCGYALHAVVKRL